jgi:hypothetical protein
VYNCLTGGKNKTEGCFGRRENKKFGGEMEGADPSVEGKLFSLYTFNFYSLWERTRVFFLDVSLFLGNKENKRIYKETLKKCG